MLCCDPILDSDVVVIPQSNRNSCYNERQLKRRKLRLFPIISCLCVQFELLNSWKCSEPITNCSFYGTLVHLLDTRKHLLGFVHTCEENHSVSSVSFMFWKYARNTFSVDYSLYKLAWGNSKKNIWPVCGKRKYILCCIFQVPSILADP